MYYIFNLKRQTPKSQNQKKNIRRTITLQTVEEQKQTPRMSEIASENIKCNI